MADTKASALPAASGVTADDLLYLVNDPAGTPASQKATAAQLLAYIEGAIGTAAFRSLIDDADAAALRATLSAAPNDATYITQTANSETSAEQALSTLATGYMKVANATGVITSQVAPIPIADIARPTHAGGWLFEAFMNGVSTTGATPTGPLELSSSSSGTGASVGSQAPPDAVSFGVVFASVGTTTTGRAGVFSALNALRFGSIAFRTRWRFQFPSLLDVTETGAFYIGFIDLNTAAPVDGIYIYWDNAQTNFRARTRANSVETDTDLGAAPVAATWYEGECYVNADATSATITLYAANGTTVLGTQTITTNIPSGVGRETAYGGNMIKSGGTTVRAFLMDDAMFAWGTAAG